MTTIERLPPTADEIARAKGLRRAVVLIATHAAPDRARTSALYKLVLMIAALERVPPRECRTCGQRFGFSAAEIEFYQKRSAPLPTHCRNCRKARRQQPSDRDPNMTVPAAERLRRMPRTVGASGERLRRADRANGLQQPQTAGSVKARLSPDGTFFVPTGRVPITPLRPGKRL